MFNFLSSCDPCAALVCIYSSIRIFGCIVHNLYCIPAYVVINLVLLPLYYISVDTYARVENVLYNWLLYVVSSWSWGGGLVVHEHGDDIYALRKDRNVKLLVIANHQSTADVPLMMQAFTSRSEYILLWVMDALFKWTNFGVVSQTHGDYFIKTKSYRNGEILKHCSSDYSRLKNLMVLFPEGGFRYKRQASSNSYAMKNNLPILTNVTYPRFGAYSECIDPTLSVTHVVDLTICYDDPEHPPSIVDIMRGRKCCEIHFYYRIHSVAENPDVRTEAWLKQQWQIKDRVLADHYAEVQRRRFGRNSSARTSLSGSLRSKPSYSSMSPMSLSKEQLNMLNNADRNTNNSTGCPINSPGNQDAEILDLSASPRGGSSTEDLSTMPNPNQNNTYNNHQNGVDSRNGGDLIKNDLSNGGANNNGQWARHASQESVDSNFPATPNTEELMSHGAQHQHLLHSSVPFDRTKGRPVVLSWIKLISIHAFYLSIIFLVYQMRQPSSIVSTVGDD